MAEPPAGRPIWLRPEPGARRPRLSRELIAAAALAIADGEGFDAVSIRRVAAALGAGAMSLYRYISAKSDLLALMEDAILAESLVPAGELPADWRDAVAAIARASRAALLAHPWAVQALHGRSSAGQDGPFGPGGLSHFEQSLAAVATAPMDTAAKLDLLAIIDDYVVGHVLRAGEEQARLAVADPGHVDAVTQYIEGQLATGRYPHLSKLARDHAAAAAADPARRADRFERGLQALLDAALADGAGPAGTAGTDAAPPV